MVGEQPRSELVRYDAKSGQFLPFLGGISATSVTFSRDGRWVAYVSFPEGELWRSRADGSQKLQLTSAPFYVFSVSWSPDGRQIAFSGHQPGVRQELYTVTPEGGTPASGPQGNTMSPA